MEKKREYTWDIAKLIAVFLVAFGHFVDTGTYALEIPGYFANALSKPLIPVEEQSFWKPSLWVLQHIGVQSAVVGVVVFFIASGYFIPMVMRRYENDPEFEGKFFVSRLKRLYPEVITCYILVSLLMWLYQGIKYPAGTYVWNALCVATLTGHGATLGVMWYLNVLIMVYLISSMIPKYTKKNVMVISGILLLLSIMLKSNLIMDSVLAPYASGVAYCARAATMCYIGIMWKLVSDSESLVNKIWWITISVLCSLVTLNLYYQASGMTETYGKPITFIVAILIILVSKLLAERLEKSTGKVGRAIQKIIDTVVGVSLAFYLLHAPVGFYTMHFLQQKGVNSSVNCIMAFVVSFVVAWIVSICIKKVSTVYSVRGKDNERKM